jgi:hypothetical protein
MSIRIIQAGGKAHAYTPTAILPPLMPVDRQL